MLRRADKETTRKRVDEVLRIRLDGAQFWDVREYVRDKQTEAGSIWLLEDDDPPLSDSQIRRYLTQADKLIRESVEPGRKANILRHLAQRKHLYAKATLAGDLRTALACAQDEAELLGLYPPKRTQLAGPKGKAIIVQFIEVAAATPQENPPRLPSPVIVGEVLDHFAEVPT